MAYLIHDDNLEVAYGVGGVADHVVQNLRSHHENTRLGCYFNIACQKTNILSKSSSKSIRLLQIDIS